MVYVCKLPCKLQSLEAKPPLADSLLVTLLTLLGDNEETCKIINKLNPALHYSIIKQILSNSHKMKIKLN